jgi:ABC-type branched-subunit amino acid transport system ATPase component
VDHLVVMDAGQVVAHGPKDAVIKALGEGRVAKAGTR